MIQKSYYRYTDVQNVKIDGADFGKSSPYMSREQFAWINEALRTGEVRGSLNPRAYVCSYVDVYQKNKVGMTLEVNKLNDFAQKANEIRAVKYNMFTDKKVYKQLDRFSDGLQFITNISQNEFKTQLEEYDGGQNDIKLTIAPLKSEINKIGSECGRLTTGILRRSNVVGAIGHLDVVRGTASFCLNGSPYGRSVYDDFIRGDIPLYPYQYSPGLSYDGGRSVFYMRFKTNYHTLDVDRTYTLEVTSPSYDFRKPPWENREPSQNPSSVYCSYLFQLWHVPLWKITNSQSHSEHFAYDKYATYRAVGLDTHSWSASDNNTITLKSAYSLGNQVCDFANAGNMPHFEPDANILDYESAEPCGYFVIVCPVFALLYCSGVQVRNIGV